MRKTGPAFGHQNLHSLHEDHMIIQPSSSLRYLRWICWGFAIHALLFSLVAWGDIYFLSLLLSCAACAMFFLFVSWNHYHQFERYMHLNRQKQSLWSNRHATSTHIHKAEYYASLKDCKAIQLLQKDLSSTEMDYIGYELNLVHSNGTRTNLLNHQRLQKMRQDATRISAFLGGLPVVDRLGDK